MDFYQNDGDDKLVFLFRIDQGDYYKDDGLSDDRQDQNVRI